MRLFAAAIFGLAGLATVPACARAPSSSDFTATVECGPKTFEGAVECLRSTLPPTTRAELLKPDGAIRAHLSFGMMLRNEWGLWDEQSPLARSLTADGFTHPDDMSGAIIDAYIATERGQRFDKSAAIKQYRRYWEKADKRTPLPLSACANELMAASDFKACWKDANGSVIGEIKTGPE